MYTIRFCLYYLLIAPLFLFGNSLDVFSLNDDFTNLFQQSDSSQKKEPPNPSSLQLNWSEYFEVADVQELTFRINALNHNLLYILSKLNGSEKDNAASYINNILLNLNTYLAEKKIPVLETASLPPFHLSYTIEDLLEINNKIKLSHFEKKNEEEELENVKAVIAKKQKQLDSLMVAYRSNTQINAAKLLSGLEIMVTKTAMLAATEHMKKMHKRLDVEKTKLAHLQRESESAKELLNFKDYNGAILEENIRRAQHELDNKQAELAKLENSLQLNASQNLQDKNARHYSSQKLLYAAVLRSLAWTNLAFHNLKYNLYMHLNKELTDTNKDLLDKLDQWSFHLDKTTRQIEEWKKSVLREQERVRQDHSLLAFQKNVDDKAIKANQTRQHNALETLSILQQLEDKIADNRWLITQLKNNINKNSSYLEMGWINFINLIYSSWTFVSDFFNYTLFKVGELPITLLSLIHIVIILSLSFFLSKFISKTLISFANRGKSVTTSTLYTLGRLAHYFTLIVGTLLALASIGFDFSNLVILASALTLGLGFGLQSFANNFICGLRILFERNLKVGDFIELQNGTSGVVMEIHVQNTIIYTADGIEIVIPNSELTNQTLINYTMNHDYRRITIPFKVSSDADKNLVRELIINAAKKVPLLAPSHFGTPHVWIKNFDKYSLEFCLAVWVNYKIRPSTGSRESEFLWEIESILREYKIPLTTASPAVFVTSANELIEI